MDHPQRHLCFYMVVYVLNFEMNLLEVADADETSLVNVMHVNAQKEHLPYSLGLKIKQEPFPSPG